MAQLCPAKSTIVPFKKQMYSSGSIILSYKDDKCICVSIHAPTRGATTCSQPVLLRWSRFNPRTHEGCDSGRTVLFSISVVSIHAPTRGATELSWKQLIALMFQSTHPRGVRQKHRDWLLPDPEFQSTHPRGVRLDICCDQVKFDNGFNPRTHEGCDWVPLIITWLINTFQSTHPRGVRPPFVRYGIEHNEFQSTHPRGVRHLDRWHEKTVFKFQSTHPRGVRQLRWSQIETYTVSIHAPTRGATH